MSYALNCVTGSAGIRSSDITFRRLKWLAGRHSVLPSGTPWASWLIASVTALLVFPGAVSHAQQEHPRIKSSQEAVALRDQEAHDAFETGDWETASKLYRTVVDENPDSGLAWVRLGHALHKLGKIDEALFAHEKASAFPNARRTALYNWACTLSIKGEHELAIDKLSAALDAGFARPPSLDEKEDFAPLRENDRFKKLVQRHKEVILANSSNGGVSRGAMSTDRGSTGTSTRVIDTKSLEQLAFWVGTWKVTDAAGAELATCVVSRDDEKHVIVQMWTGLDGSTGTGESLFDPGSSLWIQNYKGSDKNYNLAGAMSGKSLEMSGSVSLNDKKGDPCQWKLSQLDDGRLQQTMKASTDGEETWETLFEIFYVPAKKQ